MRARVIGIAVAAAGVVAGVIVGGPLGLAIAFGAATAANVVDGGTWLRADDGGAGRWEAALGGAIVGALALGAALWMSAPIEDAAARGVEWSTLPIVRGSMGTAATLGLLVVAIAFAAELTMRRWWLERVAAWAERAGWSRGGAVAAGVVAAAVIEAAIAPSGGPRVGVAVTGVALGVIYVAAGQRVAASATARVVFELGALILQALRMIG